MSSLYLLIPISLAFLALAIFLFFWAVKNNQFDDLQGPAKRIVLDDQLAKKNAEIARQANKAQQLEQARLLEKSKQPEQAESQKSDL